MTSFLSHRFLPLCFACALIGCGSNSGNPDGGNPDGGIQYLLSVRLGGTGSGRVTSQPAGIDCGSTCSASLDAGSSVVLSTAPAAGSDFTGWSGNCSGTGACTLAMDAAKMVTARFTLARVVFHSRRKLDGTDAANANNAPNIWRVNTDGTASSPLTTTTAAGNYFAQWSPEGTKAVFESTRKLDGTDAPNLNNTSNIWRVNADGTGLAPLTTATAALASSYSARWSPDGAKVVFESNRKLDGTDAPNLNNTYNIWQVNADGSGLRLITNATAAFADSSEPRWSPDGAKVVFYSSRKLDGSDAVNTNRTRNIWRVNADGTGLMPLTTATASGTDSYLPQWSPDGAWIAFDSTRKLDGTDAPNLNNTSNVWRVNADGTGLRLITNGTAPGADSYSPQWSPDGSQVAFISSRKLDGTDAANANRAANIWRANADSTGLTPVTSLTANQVETQSAHWSLDGTKLVFSSSRKLDGTDAPNVNLTQNIWRVNADGTGLAPLTSLTANMANSFSPSFSP